VLQAPRIQELLAEIFNFKTIQVDAFPSNGEIRYTIHLTSDLFAACLLLISQNTTVWTQTNTYASAYPTVYKVLVNSIFCRGVYSVARVIYPKPTPLPSVCYTPDSASIGSFSGAESTSARQDVVNTMAFQIAQHLGIPPYNEWTDYRIEPDPDLKAFFSSISSVFSITYEQFVQNAIFIPIPNVNGVAVLSLNLNSTTTTTPTLPSYDTPLLLPSIRTINVRYAPAVLSIPDCATTIR